MRGGLPPYGPIQLSHIVALIAELSVDALLDSRQATTPTEFGHLANNSSSAGGAWTEDWLAETGERLGWWFCLRESLDGE